MEKIKFKLHTFLLVIFVSLITTARVESSKILFLTPVAFPSHVKVFDPLFKVMADRGHDVTIVTPSYLPKPYKNIREIVPITFDEIFPTQGKEKFIDPFSRRREGKVMKFLSTVDLRFAIRACQKASESKVLRELFRESFDLIIINGYFNQCLHGFVHKTGAPFIALTSVASPNYVTYAAGNYLHPSFIPFIISDFTHEMDFSQRFLNFLFDQYYTIMKGWIVTPFEDIYKNHLGADAPDLETLEKNVSMIFSNSYFPLTYPRPLLPDIVEVGGMHCRPANPLTQELEEFLTGAEHGFIYFSMGSVVNTDNMAEEMRFKFLNAFSRIKQRVIWKWNSGQMDGLPENVRVSKWLPQQDILGHPNIRVFITHGGLLSTQEAAYHGVPLIGIPVFADQDLNMNQAVSKGYALKLEILELTELKLDGILEELLNKPQYAAEAKKLSSIIKDQPQTPLERAVFWSEYVIRHRGARHLRSAARKLNFVQYHSLDVIGFIGICIFSSISVLYFSWKLCIRRICHSGEARTRKQGRIYTEANLKKGL